MLHHEPRTTDIKIAIILSGQLRDYEKCFPSLHDNILIHNNCHIFMHTYVDTNIESIEKAIKLYKPQRFLLEQPVKDFRTLSVEKWPENFQKHWTAVGNIKARMDALYWQYRNLQTTFRTIPAGRYDCVVKTRYDIEYWEPIKFTEYDMKNINIPSQDPNNFGGGLFDLFAFSCYDNMQHFCNLYDKINIYVEDESIECVPEILLKHHLRNKSVNRFYFPISLRGCWMTVTPRNLNEIQSHTANLRTSPAVP